MSVLSALVSFALVAPLVAGGASAPATAGISTECYNYIGIQQRGGFVVDRLTLESATGTIYPPGSQLWTEATNLPVLSNTRVRLSGRVPIAESGRLKVSVFWGARDLVSPEITYCPNGRTAWLSTWGTVFSPQIGWS